ncbi:ABC-2 transporter permease [Miniphocaeibacter massiliensis]|uniref:ABC-2 transporter permease n=1 Tax=Miniphocaeibacter massiliensis TaxID=2041841 RepID=UPI000C1BAE87|nr:ABC-2 transporter permease [Miniphocaeibacter massiliensis]
MKALIYKDFESYKKYYIGMALFFVAFGIYMRYSTGSFIYLSAIFFLMVFMTSTMSISIDEQGGVYKFIFTAPIQKKQYVLSKYLPGIILGILGAISTFFVVKNTMGLSLELSLLFSVVAMGISLIMLNIITPILLKFGPNKGRLVMLVLYIAIFSMISNFDNLLEEALKIFNKMESVPPVVLAIILFVAIVIITGISIISSVKIVEKKEF